MNDREFPAKQTRSVQLSEKLKEEILSGKYGKPGEWFLTTRALAEECGVALVTAQRLMVALREEGVIRLVGKKYLLSYGVIPSFGTQYARPDTGKLIGVHIPRLENPYFSMLARCIEKSCRKRGYQTVICSSGYDPREEIAALDLFERLGASGVLSCPGRDPSVAVKYRQYVLPTVFLSNNIAGLPNDCVVVDNLNAGRQVAKFLIRKGYTDFLYVSQAILKNNYDERFNGFRLCLKEHGFEISEQEVLFLDPENMFAENLIGKEILKKKRPLGIFCNNDLLALDVMRACNKWNFSVPEEVGIVGFDDLSIVNGYIQSFTTVHYSLDDMADEALKILMRQMRGEKYSGTVNKISSYLITNGSAKGQN